MAEFTFKSILMGIILGIIFGMANAYLGLKVGMTVSASIPVAVISMSILRGLLRRGTILENNLVQTIGSAGESLAAGVIFTLPALIIWGYNISVLKIFVIAVLGGFLGVLFMIPLRRALIVKEHKTLPYPEGRACAEVLKAGDEGGQKAKFVFSGLGFGGIYKFIMDSHSFKLWTESPHWNLKFIPKAVVGFDTLPALLGVGYIIGSRISALMLAGGVTGWLVFIPLISWLGEHISVPIFPAEKLISQMSASEVWSYYVRYIGAGAVAFGGIVSLIKSLPTIISSFKEVIKGLSNYNGKKEQRRDKDLPPWFILLGSLILILIIWLLPYIPVNLIGAILIVIFGFFFVTVSSRIVGLIGSSSNPASGMTIATLLLTSLIFVALGIKGETGMISALSVGAIVCIAICIAGDTSQDLKTGYLVGATPYYQQIGEFIGVLTSALFIGITLIILHKGYGIGSISLPAPQATLMSLVVKGVMKGTLPWILVFTGVFVALVVELLGMPSLPFAVGLYLPLSLSTPIMVGGLVRYMVNRFKKVNEDQSDTGTLFASGLIAGDALLGVIIAIFIWRNWKIPTLGPIFKPPFDSLLSITMFLLLAIVLYRKAVKKLVLKPQNKSS